MIWWRWLRVDCLVLIGWLWVVPLFAWGGERETCPRSEQAVQVEVHFEVGHPFVDDHRSSAWIQEQAKGMHHPIGLTVSRLRHTLLGVFEWRGTVQRQTRCLYVRSVKLALSYPELKVYIANNYRPGSCEYQAIYRHEMEHVRILHQHQESYLAQLRERLQTLVHKQEGVLIQPHVLEQKKQEILQRFDQEILRELQRVDLKQKAAQAAIDTAQSYAKVRSACQHW